MKLNTNKFVLLFLSLFILSFNLFAQEKDELDSLEDLSDSDEISELEEAAESDDLSDLDGMAETEESTNDFDSMGKDSEDVSESEVQKSIQFGGYFKPLLYWQKAKYSDTAWATFANFEALGYTVPTEQESSAYSNIGSRFQFNMEAFLGDRARFYSAVNLDFEESSSTAKPNGQSQLVESYIELFQSSNIIKIGNQLVTWGYIEGVEVPTDRINARDFAYQSTEFEDIKMSSNGILWQQSFGDFSGMDLMWIPKVKTNNDSSLIAAFVPATKSLPTADTNTGKGAIRMFTTVGNLDLALSYVDGLDSSGDLYLDNSKKYGRKYNREKSPGLDLQYNFGSFLAKLAYAQHISVDKDGTDPLIKNSWTHWTSGIEVMLGSNTINFYVGQKSINDFQNSITNYLMGQAVEKTNFVSGHVNSNFLTGNALSTTLIFAYYEDGDGEAIQSIIKPSLNYKLGDGLLATLSPSRIEADGSTFDIVQTELKFSF